jgi:hypothetical protein
MGMILTGIVVAVVIAIGAGYFLFEQGDDRPAWQVYSSSSTRVGDPGHNLVGRNWTGDPGDSSAAIVDGEETPS